MPELAIYHVISTCLGVELLADYLAAPAESESIQAQAQWKGTSYC